MSIILDEQDIIKLPYEVITKDGITISHRKNFQQTDYYLDQSMINKLVETGTIWLCRNLIEFGLVIEFKFNKYDVPNTYYEFKYHSEVGCGSITNPDDEIQDCLRIRSAIKKCLDLDVGIITCANLWAERCDQWSANWLYLPSSAQRIVIDLIKYTKFFERV